MGGPRGAHAERVGHMIVAGRKAGGARRARKRRAKRGKRAGGIGANMACVAWA